MQTHQRFSFFLLLVPMAGLEGALLRVAMAGLDLFGVNFFNGPFLLVLLLTCSLVIHVLLTWPKRICNRQKI